MGGGGGRTVGGRRYPRPWMLEGLYAARVRRWGTGGKVREERERGAVSRYVWGDQGGM